MSIYKHWTDVELIEHLRGASALVEGISAELARRYEAEKQPTVEEAVEKPFSVYDLANALLTFIPGITANYPVAKAIEALIDAKIAAAMRKGDGK